MAYLIAQTITTWAYVETNLGNILASFLRAEAAVTMEMYGALNGFADQRRILQAASKNVLTGQDADLFDDTLTAITSFSNRRHRFAHWLWGICEALPDDLVLVEPQRFWSLFGKEQDHVRTLSPTEILLQDYPTLDRSKVLVYTAVDVMKNKEDVSFAYDMTTALHEYFRTNPGPEREKLYQQLYAQCPIQRARQRRQRQASAPDEIEALPPLRQTTDVY